MNEIDEDFRILNLTRVGYSGIIDGKRVQGTFALFDIEYEKFEQMSTEEQYQIFLEQYHKYYNKPKDVI